MLKEYGHLLHDQRDWAERAANFSKRVLDITETLAAGKFKGNPRPTSKLASSKDGGSAEPPVVAYHAACHLAHAQGVRKAPADLLSLLSSVAGSTGVTLAGKGETRTEKSDQPMNQPYAAFSAPVKLTALREAEHCCGSAGIYNLMHPELALKVLDRKMDNLQKTGADIVVTTNPGCLLQLETGVRRRGLKMKVQHLCELLHEYFV
jgi:glycolate oxidase iron-sulfur subunit